MKRYSQVLKRQHNRIQPRPAPGTKPGTLKRFGKAIPSKIKITAYDQNTLETLDVKEVKDIEPYLKKFAVTWINVTGLGTIDVIKELGQLLDLHSLALEDVIHTYERPKVEEYDNCVYVVCRSKLYDEKIIDEQVSFFLGKNYVLSFLEDHENCFEKVSTRLQSTHSHLRHAKSDYLLYELLDVVIDGYFPVLEIYSEAMDQLENDTVVNPTAKLVSQIHTIRQNMVNLKRDAWSQRTAISNLYREQKTFIHAKTHIYFRDCYEHTVQIIDLLENSLDRSASLIDVYLSSGAQRLNEIMKVLTIIATIFMPLSFLASLWGMNFHTDVSPWNMPELNWRFGYFMALGIMFVVAVGLLFFFWRQGWIGKSKK